MKKYHVVLQQYKKLLAHKRNEYYNNKLSELEDITYNLAFAQTKLNSNQSLVIVCTQATYNLDTKKFWNCLKSMDDTTKYKDTPPIAEENWMNYFQCLHSNKPLTSEQQKVVNELRTREDVLMHS